MIKNIVFDIGNVLVEKSLSVFDKFDLSEKEKEFLNNLLFSYENRKNLDLGFITQEELFEELKGDIPSNLYDVAKDIFFNYYIYRDFKTNMFNLLKTLKKNKYNIYILSNNNENVYNYLCQTELNDYIDGSVVSFMYNVIKPDKKIYDILIDKYNLNYNECYFIDDDINNINMAKSLGMKAYNYKDDYDDLILDLNKNNIKTN